MRKYIIGALFGIALTLTSSVFADDIKSLVGKAIQGEFAVTFEGKTLEKKAIVIDGSSYLPVKAIADSLNMDAKFDKNTGISLSKKESIGPMETVYETPAPTPQPTMEPLTLSYIEHRIKTLNSSIVSLSGALETIKNDQLKNPDIDYSARINEYENRLKAYKAELEDLEQKKLTLTQ